MRKDKDSRGSVIPVAVMIISLNLLLLNKTFLYFLKAKGRETSFVGHRLIQQDADSATTGKKH